LRIIKFVDHANTKSVKELKNEAEVRVLINKHKNFMRCYGSNTSAEPLLFTDENGDQYSYLNGHSFVVYEHCAQGSLWNSVVNSRESASMMNFSDLSDEEKTRNIFR
jgi:general stress protein 26